LQAEIDLLDDIIVHGMSMIDVGCGTGRHLTMLRNRLRTSAGCAS
jgi:ubiquinone/menaquinone biosynthesis C-methylase UbiE